MAMTSEIVAWGSEIELPTPRSRYVARLTARSPDIYVFLIGDISDDTDRQPTMLVGLDTQTGRVLWSREINFQLFIPREKGMYVDPYWIHGVITGQSKEHLFIIGALDISPTLVAIDISSGREVWMKSLDVPDEPRGIITVGQQILAAGEEWIAAFSEDSGAVLWGPIDGVLTGCFWPKDYYRVRRGGGITGKTLVTEVIGEPDSLVTVDIETGRMRRDYLPLPNGGWRNLIEGVLIQGDPESAEIVGYEATSLRRLWRFKHRNIRGASRPLARTHRIRASWWLEGTETGYPRSHEIFSNSSDGLPIRAYIPMTNYGITALEFHRGISSAPRIDWENVLPDYTEGAGSLWSLPLDQQGRFLYLRSRLDQMVIIDAEEGKQVGIVELPSVRQLAQLYNNNCVVGTSSSLLLMDGPEIVWKHVGQNYYETYSVGGLVYAFRRDGTVHILDAIDGSFLSAFSLSLSDQNPSIVDEMIRELVIFEESNGPSPNHLFIAENIWTNRGDGRQSNGIRISDVQSNLQRGVINRAEIIAQRAEALWRAGLINEAEECMSRGLSVPGLQNWRIHLAAMRMNSSEQDTAGALEAASSVYELTSDGEPSKQLALTIMRELIGIQWISTVVPAARVLSYGISQGIVFAKQPLKMTARDLESGSIIWSTSFDPRLWENVFRGPDYPGSIFMRRADGIKGTINLSIEARDIQSGDLIWSRTLEGQPDSLFSGGFRTVPIYYPPNDLVTLVVGNTDDSVRSRYPADVLSALMDATLFRVDPRDGAIVWSKRVPVAHEIYNQWIERSLMASTDYVVIDSPKQALGITCTSNYPGASYIHVGDCVLAVNRTIIWDTDQFWNVVESASSDTLHFNIRRAQGDTVELLIDRSSNMPKWKRQWPRLEFQRNPQYMVFETTNGDSIGHIPIHTAIRQARFVGESGLLIVGYNSTYSLLNLQTGEEVWNFSPVSQNIVGVPNNPTTDLIADSALVDWGYSPANEDVPIVFLLNIRGPEEGNIRWIRSIRDRTIRATAVDSQYVAVVTSEVTGSSDIRLDILDTQTGNTVHMKTLPNWIPYSIQLWGSRLLLVTEEGYIYMLDINN